MLPVLTTIQIACGFGLPLQGQGIFFGAGIAHYPDLGGTVGIFNNGRGQVRARIITLADHANAKVSQ